MFTLFSLFRLALSLGFFSYFDDLHSHTRPLARAEADCACPIQTVGYQQCRECGVERVGVDCEAPTYVVEVRQTGKRDSTMSWPRVTLCPSQQAKVCVSGDTMSWLMSIRLEKVAGETASLDVELTSRGPEGKSATYKGRFDCKLGACNLTALGGDHLPEPLAVSLCVKKATTEPAPPRVAGTLHMPRPVPQMVTALRPPVPVMMPAPMPILPVYAPVPVYPYPVIMQQVAATASVMPARVITLVKEDGRSKLCLKAAGVTTTGTRMTVDGVVKLAAGTKYVHVKGDDFSAMAERVEVVGDRVRMCGSVKLTCDKVGPGAEVKADCLCVRVKDGKFVELIKCECPAGCCPVPTVTPNRSN